MSLKFEVIERNYNDELSNIENYLVSKGVENPDMFLNPENYEEKLWTDPTLFYNMDLAVDIFVQSIVKDEQIGILVDDDADGYTSAAALIKYIKDLKGNFLNIEWFFHEKKSHGLTKNAFKEIMNSKCDLIIIPDAASNDFDEQIAILEKNKKLIILDHHNVDNQEEILNIGMKYKDKYALVNNHLKYNVETNENFVGAGMIYKFCEAVDMKLGSNISNNILDLVAIGQVADMSDVSDYEIRLLLKRGLSNINSPIAKFIFKDNIDKQEKISARKLSFSIIPIMNAISRIGKEEEKDLILKSLFGFWDEDATIVVERRRKNKASGKFEKVELTWSYYEYIYDIITKIKAKQDKIVNNTQKKSSEYMNEGKIAIINMPKEDVEFRSVTGLIANKIVSQKSKPALFFIDTNKKVEGEKIYAGSGRGYEKTIEDFRKWCNNTELFELAQGHGNAFGVEIKESNLKKLIDLSNKGFEDTEYIYLVDKLYNGIVNYKEVVQVNGLEYLFGGSVSAPKYGYKDILFTRNSVKQRGTVLTFWKDDLEFVAYKQTPGFLDDIVAQMGFNRFFKVSIVGRPAKNEWTGSVKHQIVVEDFTIEVFDGEIEKVEGFVDADGEFSF